MERLKILGLITLFLGISFLASGQINRSQGISSDLDMESRSVPSTKGSDLNISRDRLNELRAASSARFSGILTTDKNNLCVINRVAHPSPAGEAGLIPGDIILAIDGNKIQSTSRLGHYIRRIPKDHLTHWTIKRGDIIEVYTLRMIDRTQRKDPEQYLIYNSFLKATLEQNLMDNRLYISSLEEDGLAFDHGLQVGDHLFQFNDVYLNSARDIRGIVKSLKERTAPLIVKRDNVPLDILLVW